MLLLLPMSRLNISTYLSVKFQVSISIMPLYPSIYLSIGVRILSDMGEGRKISSPLSGVDLWMMGYCLGLVGDNEILL